jgi:predicted P-loop ATPase
MLNNQLLNSSTDMDAINDSGNNEETGNEESLVSKPQQIKDYLLNNYDFRFNIITRRLEFRKNEGQEFLNFNDRDLNTVWFSCLENEIECSKSNIRDILNSNFSKVFDPFKEYFDSLIDYDGQVDYVKKFTDCFRLVNENERDYFEKYFKIFMRGIVGCAYDSEPNHTCLTLVGKQGIFKTTALNYLCPKSLRDKYLHSGSILGDKDSQIRLSTCFLINNDEFSTLNRTDIETFKSMLTLKEIQVRLPYGHYSETLFRRASFVGSLNKLNFLNDTTGSRRFLIFEVENIDIDALTQIDMDCIYSQAYSDYRKGNQYYLRQEDNVLIQSNNRRFDQFSMLEELLMVRYRVPQGDEKKQYLTATQIADELSKSLKHKPSEADIRKVGSYMSKHGFEQKCKRINGIFSRYWIVKKCRLSTRFES